MNGGVLRRLAAEFVGTALLLAVVVGSGIMGERLANGNTAIALLANSLATGAGLFVLILTFAPVSGAHFNPLVTASATLDRTLSLPVATGYLVAQLSGALCGVALAHTMFEARRYVGGLDGQGAHRRHFQVNGGSGLVPSALVLLLGAALWDAVLAPTVGTYIAAALVHVRRRIVANPVVTLIRGSDPYLLRHSSGLTWWIHCRARRRRRTRARIPCGCTPTPFRFD